MKRLLLKIAKLLARWSGYELHSVLAIASREVEIQKRVQQAVKQIRKEYETAAEEDKRTIKHLQKRLLFGSPVLPVAAELIAQQDKIANPATSGEHKRHNVYAKLIKLYPNVERKHLAKAIELSICLE